MTTIRDATLEDVPRLVEMGQRFRTELYAERLADNPAQMAVMATRLITEPDGLLLVAVVGTHVVGMIGMLFFMHHLSGEATAAEIFWWVEPEHRGSGVRLMKRAERWAILQGATVMQMVAPTRAVAVAQLYERLGYTACEVAYDKPLSGGQPCP